jgi:hypothetical protein
MDTYAVAIEGLAELSTYEELPALTIKNARLTVNSTARRALPAAARGIRRQVNFPASYLSGEKGRLQITKFASDDDLEAVITGRHRPTSLARFVTGTLKVGGANRKAGLRVEVKPGSAQRLPGAFLIRLRAGNANLDTKSNLGVAVRTKAGRIPPGYKPLPIADNLWLLFGPAVDQVFYSARTKQGVANDIAPDMANFMEREFQRLMELDL